MHGGELIRDARGMIAGDRSLDFTSERGLGPLISKREDPQNSRGGGFVEREIQSPHMLWDRPS